MKKFLNKKYVLYAVGGIASGFLNGLFGSGGGTVIVPFEETFLDMDEKHSHATAIFIISGFTVISIIFYAINSHINIGVAVPSSIGGVFGGFLGAKLLSALSGKAIRKTFGIFMLIAAVKMVMS